jgi:hypothetical protein
MKVLLGGMLGFCASLAIAFAVREEFVPLIVFLCLAIAFTLMLFILDKIEDQPPIYTPKMDINIDKVVEEHFDGKPGSENGLRANHRP